MSGKYERIIVIEEMMPFIENELKINGIDCIEKGYDVKSNDVVGLAQRGGKGN